MQAETESGIVADNAATELSKDDSYKKKQIVVALLLAGLIVAILTQPDTDDTAGQIVEAAFEDTAVTPVGIVGSTQVASKAEPAESADSLTQQLGQTHELSRIELGEIVRLELLAPEPLRFQEEFVNQTQQVQAVYGTSSGHAALLGESILRRGQALPRGGKVLQITTDGIHVAP